MKKLCVMALCFGAAVSMSAQVALVKQAEKSFKSADTYAALKAAEDQIKPAFTNPETEKDANTYWVPGKAAYKVYDNYLGQATVGKDVNQVDMAQALLDGYNYGMKALAVDTVVDAKGKVKTKFSKEITGTIAAHLNDYLNMGSSLWDAQKYPQAYEMWTAYLTTPENPKLGKSAPAALPDSLVAQISYFSGLAAWQAEMLPQAAEAFERMMKIGYKEMPAYDYAYSVAYQMGDEKKKLEYSQIAFDKWGTAKPEFLQRIVSSYINLKDYDAAMKTLNEAIAANPTDGTSYYLLGVLYDDQKDKVKSQENFKKAVEIDPNNALANFSYGTSILQQWEALADEAAKLSNAEYVKFRDEKMNPLLREAATYLEKAYQLDDTQRNALTNLKIVYYNLNDGENLKRIETLLL